MRGPRKVSAATTWLVFGACAITTGVSVLPGCSSPQAPLPPGQQQTRLANPQSEGADPDSPALPVRKTRGYQLYLAHCASCHGRAAQGGSGPALRLDAELSTAALSGIIRRGVKGKMPPFASKLNHDQILALVGYIHTLQF